jgi:hypothetical protein
MHRTCLAAVAVATSLLTAQTVSARPGGGASSTPAGAKPWCGSDVTPHGVDRA